MRPAELALLAERRQLTTQLALTILGATLLVSAVLLALHVDSPAWSMWRGRGGALLFLLAADRGRWLLFTRRRRSEIQWEVECGYSCAGSG